MAKYTSNKVIRQIIKFEKNITVAENRQRALKN